jgi:sugar diacid utilization regulator
MLMLNDAARSAGFGLARVARPIQSANGKQVDLETALRSLARVIDQALRPSMFGKLIDIRNDEIIAIICSDSETAHGVVEALRRHGIGERKADAFAAAVGVSLDVTQIARLPDALGEARAALGFADATQPIMHFAEIRLPEFLIRLADNAAVRLIPDWAHRLSDPADDRSGELQRTIRAFADCSLNVKQTAVRLGLHTNTVYFRLNQITELTGIDPRTYSGTSLLLTVLRLLEIHGGAKNS